ncbi:hypothetical protein CEUSTIGMA_g7941.t1 [Chlamydomonas eustigma]|uniref:ubiquitinyl hydrolase 1 n=1 Tax=Chlamydomonas eustigma TaxID=1157962 RepID=A0A250XBN4_9CHLO|nr:hypothetical protein CEUSTIGMA_g7941.t1 [Chlamydomonas eustigma]|eukprot:GAX80503.1 hypothetical protein CEUSTIGMA_g7941.t1 [Chlamydomonas eustigma]
MRQSSARASTEVMSTVHGHVSFPLVLTREDCQVLKGGTQALSTQQGLYSGLFVQRNKVQLMHSCITIQREAEKLQEAASMTLESSAEERSYQLVAVVVHSGEGATTGHYFTYCKGRTTTHASESKDVNLLTAGPAAEEKNFLAPAVSNGSMTWFCVSDKYVRAVTVEEVLASEAFILLYEGLN